MTNDNVWVISLGDGTFVEMDDRPIAVLVTRDYLNRVDTELGGEFPIDCVDDNDGAWETHIHIQDLVLER